MTYPTAFIRFCLTIGLSQTELEKYFDPIRLDQLNILFEDSRQQTGIIDSVIAIQTYAEELGHLLQQDTVPTYGYWPQHLAYQIAECHIMNQSFQNTSVC